jgi:hypothetical protein
MFEQRREYIPQQVINRLRGERNVGHSAPLKPVPGVASKQDFPFLFYHFGSTGMRLSCVASTAGTGQSSWAFIFDPLAYASIRAIAAATQRDGLVRLDGIVRSHRRGAARETGTARDRIERVAIFVPVCDTSCIKRHAYRTAGIDSIAGPGY